MIGPTVRAARPALQLISLRRPSAATAIVGFSAFGLLAWILGIRDQPLRLSEYGLLPSLGPWYWIGTLATVSAFLAGVFLRVRERLAMLGVLVAMAVTLDCTPLILEHAGRFTYQYVSYGYADYILRHHATDPGRFVYFNWPLHHILVALVAAVGVPPSVLLAIGPLIANAVIAALVGGIGYAASGDRTVGWAAAGMWVVTSLNDAYVLPATTGLMLALLTLCLVLFQRRVDPRRAGRRQILLACALTAALATVATHLLSSLYLLLVLAGMSIVNRNHRLAHMRIPVVAVMVCFVAWQFFAAGAWTQSSLPGIVHSLFRIDKVAMSSTQFAFAGSASHGRVALVRLAMYLLAAASAAAAWCTQVLEDRHIRTSTAVVAIGAGAPFALVLATSYNGEIVSRAFGLALPMLAVGTALWATRRAGRAVLLVVALAFTAAYPVYAYGDEMLDYVSPAEISASQYFIKHMPRDFRLTNAVPRTVEMGRIERFVGHSGGTKLMVTFAGAPFERARLFWGLSTRSAGMVPSCLRVWYSNSQIRIYVCRAPG